MQCPQQNSNIAHLIQQALHRGFRYHVYDFLALHWWCLNYLLVLRVNRLTGIGVIEGSRACAPLTAAVKIPVGDDQQQYR